MRPANVGVVAGRRYYSPRIGRWTNRDPIGEKGGTNLLCFVVNRPARGWDRLGLSISTDLDNPNCKARLDEAERAVGDPHALDKCLDACDSCVWCTWQRKHACHCSCWAKFPPVLRAKTRAQLIAEWEALHYPRLWPDPPPHMVHHVVPLADGGEDSGANIEPEAVADHFAHHRDNGDFGRWGRRAGRRCRPADPLDME